MENKNTIKLPREINDYLWTRYLPETSYKMYLLIGYLMEKKIKGDEATKAILGANIKIENNISRIIEEKKRVLEKLGFKYPENRKEDLELLLNYKLIKIGKDKDGNLVYVFNIPVPKPEDVLVLDEEEKQTIENIKFELINQNAINMIITLLLNNRGNIMCSVEHIQNNTKVKIADIRKVLDYLVEEGSISVKVNKDIEKLKKSDKLYIKINKEIFEQKRFILDEVSGT